MIFNKKNLLACTVGATAMMLAAPAMAQEANTFEDEVIATGILSSIKRAQDIKRDAVGVVDAIAAEDLGKFPDLNVAESLQRISGLAIDRSGGEGQSLTLMFWRLSKLQARQFTNPDAQTSKKAVLAAQSM